MLADCRILLEQAQQEGYAVGAFNTYNLEITMGIIRAAEQMQAPVILQVGASALEYGGMEPLTALVSAAAKAADVPVAVHLDHSKDLGVLKSCIERGFTSVMFDGSDLAFSGNVRLTRKAATLAHGAGVPIEGELGMMVGEEDGGLLSQRILPYTDPDQATEFVQETGVDMLAVAIGNRHGFYEDEPRLDLERLAAIAQRVDVPLVLHGASGIPDDMIQEAIKRGIRKINVNTDLRVAFFDTLEASLTNRHPAYNLPRLMANSIEALADVAADKIAAFRLPAQMQG